MFLAKKICLSFSKGTYKFIVVLFTCLQTDLDKISMVHFISVFHD